ncbi:hypothetical protein CRUP_000945, partial [Coryphaenoides rupestris]
HSVHLVLEDLAYTGYHQLLLEVFDQQDYSAVHNISVHVCECGPSTARDPPNCQSRMVSKSIGSGGAIGIMFGAMLLLLGILLLAILLSCKRESVHLPDEGTQQHLIPSNLECLGSDCKRVVDGGRDVLIKTNYSNWTQNASTDTSHWRVNYNSTLSNTLNWRANNLALSNTANWGTDNGSVRTNSIYYAPWEGQDYFEQQAYLLQFLDKRIRTLQGLEAELGDYAPHLYADEGHPDSSPLLDPIPLTEVPFHEDMLLELGPRFNTLASLCRPDDTSL